MIIVKTGNLPSLRLWRGTCNGCKSEAEAKECEMTHIVQDPRDSTKVCWMVCPVCGAGDQGTGYGGMLFSPVRESE